MDTVEVFMKQVRCWLPPLRRDAVIARIREDLEEAIADRREPADVQAALDAFGKPPVVAARYADMPHVIPAMLTSAYIAVLLFAAVVSAAIHVLMTLPRIASGASWTSSLADSLAGALVTLPFVYTGVTLAFTAIGWIVQRSGAGARPGCTQNAR